MTIKLGLTGSIGMGKSTTAQMFADRGCAIWDADAAVHRLYNGGAAVAPMMEKFPSSVINGVVDRLKLKQIIQENQSFLTDIEGIVHPLVRQDMKIFSHHVSENIAVFDIPLLYENNLQDQFDAVACVSISKNIQKQRVMRRFTMTEAEFEFILSKQMPNTEKCSLADYVISTHTIDTAQQAVEAVMKDLSHA